MINVLHSCPHWLPITENWIFNLLKYLPDEDLRNYVACNRVVNLDRFPFNDIHNFEDESKLLWLWDKGLRKLGIRHHLNHSLRIAKRISADILHSHFGYMGWMDREVKKRLNIKHVVTFYGADVSRYPTTNKIWHERYKELFESADLFLCEGPHMANCLMQLGCNEEKIRVQHLGVEVHKIRYKPRRWSADEPLRLLIAASFREKKGIPYALEALKNIKNELSIEITIIGDSTNDEKSLREKNEIMKAIENCGLEKVTKLLGFQPQSVLWNEAYKNHIFIAPSIAAEDGDTEGGAPVVLLEMAASGMPIVSSMHCDIPHVIKHGETGWLAPEKDIVALEKCIQCWIENADEWRKILNASRMHVESEFDVRELGIHLSSLYEKIIN